MRWLCYKLCRFLTLFTVSWGKGGRSDDLNWHYRRGKTTPTPCPYRWPDER